MTAIPHGSMDPRHAEWLQEPQLRSPSLRLPSRQLERMLPLGAAAEAVVAVGFAANPELRE